MNNSYILKSISFLIVLFGLCQTCRAQTEPISNQDSVSIDSTAQTKKPSKTKPYNFIKSFKGDYPHPKTATYLALAIPGAGQAYNKDFWKIPIVWAAYGGIGYSIYFFNERYQRFNQAVILGLRMEPNGYPNVPISVLRSNRDISRKYLEYSYLGAVLVHVLAATEAYVAAHLKSFDISDDLSYQIKPGLIQDQINLNGVHAGISLQFSF